MTQRRHRYSSPALTSLADLVALWTSADFQASWYREAAGELETTSWKLLYRIAVLGPTRPSELAELLSTTRSNISKIVAQLESSGLITRTPDPDDRRGVQIALTTAGSAEAQRVFDAGDQMMQQLLADWPEGQQQQFAALLDDFLTRAHRHAAARRL